MPTSTQAPALPAKILWLARLEHRFHAWREKRARRRGLSASIVPFPGYGGEGWVRVVGRVLIVRPPRDTKSGEISSLRGWRSFISIPVGYSEVKITVAGRTHTVVSDRGGVVDTVVQAELESGWQTLELSVENSEPVEARVFIVGSDVKFGVVSDVDDTVMVTALPRPLIAAWNSFVVDEHARLPVPGMAVLLERLVRSHPGAPMIYLSTGAWNIAPTLTRFLSRHLFPPGGILLTDWGPTHDRWFRSGREHKLDNLRRLATEFPQVQWLLIGDDGQHDESIYTEFAKDHPGQVRAVAIRRLSATEAVLAGGRQTVDDHSDAQAPWVTASDGAGILDKLERAGLV